MPEGLFVIVSKVPERISQYTWNLRTFKSSFLFFSDVASFMQRRSYSNLRLLIFDNVDGDLDVVESIHALRRADIFDTTVFVIVSQDGCESGLTSLMAGGHDYLPYSLVDRELAARVRIHLNSRGAKEKVSEVDDHLDEIYPIEDRIIIKSALWHITNHLASIKSVSDLSFHVGRSENDLNRVFSLHTGETAFSYMRSYRIKKAKDLLGKTRLPITQIAQEVGYSSSANFSTAFKNTVGMNPRNYRRQTLLTS